MKPHWYAIYTRPLKERKVSLALNKLGIENFCPVISTSNAKDYKQTFIPLLNSHVFVYINDSQFSIIKNINYVINILYWKAKPAIINNEEIEMVKHLTNNFDKIRVELSNVNTETLLKIQDQPRVTINNHSISLTNKSVKVSLPSMGYTLIAERIGNKKEFIRNQDPGFMASLPKILNDFFF